MTSKINDAQEEPVTPTVGKKRPTSEDDNNTSKKIRWVQIRLFPIWLRIVLVLALFAGAAALGLMVGYGYIGEGNPDDALKFSTWQHLIDIVTGVE